VYVRSGSRSFINTDKTELSVEECALSLLNNGQYFLGQNAPELLVQAGIEQLWQASAYSGTCGESVRH